MKHIIQKTISSLIFIAVITVTSSCALTVSENHPPRHRQRTVWISGVSYRQVYYVQNNDVVIVSQEEIKHKSKHGNNGKHKGHYYH